MFNALNSLSMCISGSHSSNPSLTFMRHPFQTIVLFGWRWVPIVESIFKLIISIFVGPFMHWMSYLHAFYASYISLYAMFLFWSYFYILVLWVKIQNYIKSEKFKKLDCICLSTYHMWVLPCTCVQMALCIYELSLFLIHLYLCGKNLDIYVWLL